MNVMSVLTADLVGSSRWSPELRSGLSLELRQFLSDLQSVFPFHFEWYRGDSFQCLVHNPGFGLRLLLLQQCWIKSRSLFHPELKKPEVRISLATGPVSLLATDLGSSHGEAFEKSGRGLDQLKNGKRRLAIFVNGPEAPHWENTGILLDALISGLTAAQCLVVLYKLLGKTETQIQDLLHISQSAVNQRSASAHYAAFEKSVLLFESQHLTHDSTTVQP